MSIIHRYGIFAILDKISSDEIRHEQYFLTQITKDHQSLRFPVHITLKGRFLAEENIIINKWHKFNFNTLVLPLKVSLSLPLYVSPDLVWLEVLSNDKVYKNLVNLHNFFENELETNIVKDEVPNCHKKIGFRPHITLGWKVTKEAWLQYKHNKNFQINECKIGNINLVKYPTNWMNKGLITVVA
jgi:hypothetical protein